MTLNPEFNVTPLFDAEYLRDGTRQRHSHTWNTRNRDLHMRYSRVSLRKILSELSD